MKLKLSLATLLFSTLAWAAPDDNQNTIECQDNTNTPCSSTTLKAEESKSFLTEFRAGTVFKN